MKETQAIQKSYIAVSFLNALLCLTAILLNSATLNALRKTSALPRNLKILLLSLVVSDLGVRLACASLANRISYSEAETVT